MNLFYTQLNTSVPIDISGKTCFWDKDLAYYLFL